MARLICATVRIGAPGAGVTFRAGAGVGTVTRAGLPVAPGEPAINPVPRRMIRDAIAEVAAAAGRAAECRGRDFDSRRRSAGGENAQRPARHCRRPVDPRHHRHRRALFVLGLDRIRSIPGIDVARAAGLTHIAGATGASSEAAVQKLYGLPEIALIDMGDFVGGMLKYLRRHPVPRVTIAGGVAKMTKLAQGLTDLHSKRGEVDLAELANFAAAAGGSAQLVRSASSAPIPPREAFALAQAEGIALGDAVARAAQATARGRRRRPRYCGRSRVVRPRAEIWSAARRSKRDLAADPLTRRLRGSGGDNPHRRARCRGNLPRRARGRQE